VSAIFDRFARPYGGAYSPDPKKGPGEIHLATLLRRSRVRSLKYIKAFYPDPANYRLEVGFFFNGKFNARAGMEKDSGLDCAAIYLGFPYIIRDLFYGMFGRVEILPQIGNSRIENNRAYNPQVYEIDLRSFTPLPQPNDHTRSNYSNWLFCLAFYFMFQHEFCHIFHGHVDWLKKHSSLRALGEAGLSASELENMDIQTLEMDADCFAVIDVLRGILGAFSDPSGRNRDVIPKSNPLGSPRDAIFAVLFAVYSVFRIFGGNDIPDDDKDIFKTRHPPATFRQQFILGSTLEYIRQNDVIPMPEFGRIFVDALVEAEQAFAVLAGTSALSAPQVNLQSGRVGKLSDQLLQNLKKLKPELDLLKRGGDIGP
jgi:hypothetical protein